MKFSLFSLASLSLGISSLIFIIFSLKFAKKKLHFLWVLFNLPIFFWALFAFLISFSHNADFALLLWRIAVIPITFISITFLVFIQSFCEVNKKNMTYFAYLQGLLFSLLAFSNLLIKNVRLIFNELYYATPSLLYTLWFALWLVIVSYCHFLLIKTYIHTPDKNKKLQISYLFVGSALGFIGGIHNFVIVYHPLTYPFGNFFIIFYAFIDTYAIFKYQLLDIKIVFQRSFVYSILIALITATYFIFIFLIENIFKGILGYKSLFLSIFSAFVITMFFNPIKNRIQHLADKLFLGKDPIQIAEENELLKQELLRSEKLKAVATLASGMAHEIKNPLTAIKTFAEYLPKRRDDQDFLDKFSKIVGSEVRKIDDLVHQLLDFSKPSILILEHSDINRLIDETIQLLNNQFIQQKISIIRNYNLSSSDRILKLDHKQIKQVFLNLFLNSIDAMPTGGKIEVQTYKLNKNVVISIFDSGCGISQKDLLHIFEPFYSTKEKGSGLGLSIVDNIIRMHGGNIKVESPKEKGTNFLIDLPVR